MTDPDYIAIPDADVAAERPITTGLMTKLRDNPLACLAGADGAPRVQTKAISPGGSSADGPFDDSSPDPVTPGYYEFSSFTRTTPTTFPCFSIIRVKSDFVLSDVMTIAPVSTPALDAACRWLGAEFGADAGATADNNGAGSIGAGGGGTGAPLPAPGTDLSFGDIDRWWGRLQAWIGGRGGKGLGTDHYTCNPGGCLILIVDGDIDLTGGTITANGDNGIADDAERQGGAGGGSVIIICNGTQTAGTLEAKGGNGGNSGGDVTGSGGGGLLGRVASVFTGTRINTVTGGAGDSPIAAGGDGYAEETILTQGEINSFMVR